MRELLPIPSILAGVAGEYYVAAELSRRGYIASISLKNTRGIDILATNQEGTRSVTIQVKTNQLSKAAWLINQKGENYVASTHFYVFVMLASILDRPCYYIVPSKDVAAYIKTNHAAWLSSPGRNGRKRQDSPIRKFQDLEDKYLERWELLGLGDWFAQYFDKE